ncbi:MAG: hypothetical protein J6A05_04645 [Oscillospiraceae bacterium]|nr:hypothetical protein [Oscillospiraceae bacterium]
MKIDWIRKLTSRKLWVAIASLVSNIIIVCGGTESETVQVTALIMAGATVIGYIFGEGLVDSASAKATEITINNDTSEFDSEE